MRGPDMSEPRHGLRKPCDASTLGTELDAVVADLRASSVLSDQSLRRLDPLFERFGWFAESSAEVGSLASVTPDVVDRFVRARTSRERTAPKAATMHAR